ncbi:hypothetical protein [Pleionea mediterranea]|nr:hypothetical protein [Pleionea mediterranea]
MNNLNEYQISELSVGETNQNVKMELIHTLNQSILIITFDLVHMVKIVRCVTDELYLIGESNLQEISIDNIDILKNEGYSNSKLIKLNKEDDNIYFFKVYGDITIKILCEKINVIEKTDIKHS